MKRFERTTLLVGEEAFKRLTEARVIVVGLGAVGSYAVEALARAGVGHLRLVDFDEIKESNANRQLYALSSTIGRKKTEVAKERVLEINPSCHVETMTIAASGNTHSQILEGRVDGLVDAIDDVSGKIALLAAARKKSVRTIVSIMGAATRMSPGLVEVADLSKTKRCPLARQIRKALRKDGIEEGISCVFSTEEPRNMGMTAKPDAHPERTPLGSMPCLPGIFGLTGAHHMIVSLMGNEMDYI